MHARRSSWLRPINKAPAMRRSWLASFLLVSLVAVSQPQTIRAEGPKDGPNKIFNDEFIENLSGDWKLARKIRATEVTNTCKAEWVLNHQFLQIHMKDVADPPTYEA